MKNKRNMLPVAAVVVAGASLAVGSTASAHNRGQVRLPNGKCVVVGSLKSVELPDGSLVDLRPETPQDEIGAAFAANQGHSHVEIGDCSD